jgi:hypothetical protein
MSILRFKCQQNELSESLKYFANLHKYDDKETLKLYFTEWLEKNKSYIDNERDYLNTHHYETNIEAKLYKSIKYYYIKKYLKSESPKEKKERSYVVIPKELMEQIQHDIETAFNENPRFKPSQRFLEFKQNKVFDEHKLKKAYKNQYYQIKTKK